MDPSSVAAFHPASALADFRSMLASIPDESVESFVQDIHTEIAFRIAAAQHALAQDKKKSASFPSTRRQLQVMDDLRMFLRCKVGVSGVLTSEKVRSAVEGAFAPQKGVAGKCCRCQCFCCCCLLLVVVVVVVVVVLVVVVVVVTEFEEE
jgi:Flp pilus assembly protein TadB